MTTDSYRQVALRLHAMHPTDREWMLARLESDARTRLRRLLKELRSLGFPADPALLREVAPAQSSLPPVTGLTNDTAQQAIHALCAATLADITALLADESELCVAALVGAYPWPWRQSYLQAGDPERRRRLEALIADIGVMTSAARGVLLKQAADRLSRLPANASPSHAGRVVPFWKKFLPWPR